EQIVDTVCTQVEGRRGGVLSSGMEYPGRYSRWHLAYVNPCAELVARGRRISARALNARGEVLLPVLGAALLRVGEAIPGAGGRDVRAGGEVEVEIPERPACAPRRTGAAGPPSSPPCGRWSPP